MGGGEHEGNDHKSDMMSRIHKPESRCVCVHDVCVCVILKVSSWDDLQSDTKKVWSGRCSSPAWTPSCSLHICMSVSLCTCVFRVIKHVFCSPHLGTSHYILHSQSLCLIPAIYESQTWVQVQTSLSPV